MDAHLNAQFLHVLSCRKVCCCANLSEATALFWIIYSNDLVSSCCWAWSIQLSSWSVLMLCVGWAIVWCDLFESVCFCCLRLLSSVMFSYSIKVAVVLRSRYLLLWNWFSLVLSWCGWSVELSDLLDCWTAMGCCLAGLLCILVSFCCWLRMVCWGAASDVHAFVIPVLLHWCLLLRYAEMLIRCAIPLCWWLLMLLLLWRLA